MNGGCFFVKESTHLLSICGIQWQIQVEFWQYLKPSHIILFSSFSPLWVIFVHWVSKVHFFGFFCTNVVSVACGKMSGHICILNLGLSFCLRMDWHRDILRQVKGHDNVCFVDFAKQSSLLEIKERKNMIKWRNSRNEWRGVLMFSPLEL